MLHAALKIFKDTGHPTRSVVHVGMGRMDELSHYKKTGFSNVLFVEADEVLCVAQAGRKDVEIINAVISDVAEEVSFYRASNRGLSSSILKPEKHIKHFPGVKFAAPVKLRAETLDQALQRSNNYNSDTIDLLVLDIQGAELLALKSFSDLHKVAVVQLEVNFVELYKGGAKMNETLEFFYKNNFRLVKFNSTRHGYGDAIFVNSSRWQVADYTFVVHTAEPFCTRVEGGMVDQLGHIFKGRLFAETSAGVYLETSLRSLHTPGRGGIFDFFEPIARVNFSKQPRKDACMFKQHEPWCNAKNHWSITARAGDLKVKPKIEQHVIAILNNNPNLLAVHVRRGDKGWENPLAVSMEEVLHRCDAHDGPIYLATDTPEVQQDMIQRYGERLIYFDTVRPSSSWRKTSLEHAVVDLAVCVEAPEVLPDTCSGWYHLITAFREVGASLLRTSKKHTPSA